MFRELADAGINVDMIVQNTRAKGLTDISFTLAKTDLEAPRGVRVLSASSARRGHADDSIGSGLHRRCRHEVQPRCRGLMFETLADAGINIEMISTSSIRISCVVRAERWRCRAPLHTAFGLDAA